MQITCLIQRQIVIMKMMMKMLKFYQIQLLRLN